MSAAHQLTSIDILAHREWRARNKPSSGFASFPEGRPSTPFVSVSPSDGTFYLIAASGSSCAGSVPGGLRPEALLALLYNERIEPGFCDAIADATLTIEEALRTPAERRSCIERANAARATANAAKLADIEAARRRRVQLVDPVSKIATSDLTLDDLFG